MYEERESDCRGRERRSPTQPDGRPTSEGGGEQRRQVGQSAAGADESGQERGLTRANGMSPYTPENPSPPSRSSNKASTRGRPGRSSRIPRPLLTQSDPSSSSAVTNPFTFSKGFGRKTNNDEINDDRSSRGSSPPTDYFDPRGVDQPMDDV